MDDYAMRQSDRWFETPAMEEQLTESSRIQTVGNDDFPININIPGAAPSQGEGDRGGGEVR